MADISTNLSPNVPTNYSMVKPPKRTLARTLDRPQITILHPGYEYAYAYLFALPAVDEIVEASSQNRTWGLHHGTVLIAGGIIAGNAFDDVYLSHDHWGKKPVKTPRDGILEEGQYYMQLNSIAGGMTDTSTTPPPSSSTTTLEQYRYPIFPSFEEWYLPKNLPEEWQQPHNPPNEQTFNLPVPDYVSSRPRCYITDMQIGIKKAHLIPPSQAEWYMLNGFYHYSPISPGRTGINDQCNKISLSHHLHLAFDRSLFVIIPKPSAGSSSSGPQSSTSTVLPTMTTSPTSNNNPQQYAFAVHVLSNDDEASGLIDNYHNLSLQPKYLHALNHKFLFVRFAWALFPHLTIFLHHSYVARKFIISKGDEWGYKKMTSLEYIKSRGKGGQNRNGSKCKKRRVGEVIDEDHGYEDDVSEHVSSGSDA
ncbi:hypothetical protein F4680DRAFT_466174 [Xylaria scruposa]|nr:hypothetical protein F4680DRAFT_466174 [Xylaria scruposa]